MKTAENNVVNLPRDKHILIAVDESDSSKRAVQYVADFLSGAPGFCITLLSLIPIPEDDYVYAEEETAMHVERRRVEASMLLQEYRKILMQSGFPEKKVFTQAFVKDCPSISECILEEQRRAGYCTIVVGRRKVSKKEEFLFGSTSTICFTWQRTAPCGL